MRNRAENTNPIGACPHATPRNPDFTRGAWKTAKPVTIGSVDLDKMGYERKDVKKDAAQLHS